VQIVILKMITTNKPTLVYLCVCVCIYIYILEQRSIKIITYICLIKEYVPFNVVQIVTLKMNTTNKPTLVYLCVCVCIYIYWNKGALKLLLIFV
jgi:hypothetical protein